MEVAREPVQQLHCFLCWYLMTQTLPSERASTLSSQECLTENSNPSRASQGSQVPCQEVRMNLSGTGTCPVTFTQESLHGVPDIRPCAQHSPSLLERCKSIPVSVKSHLPYARLYRAVHLPSDACHFDPAPHNEFTG